MKTGPKPQDPSVLFWSHVNKDGPIPAHIPEMSNCWIWTAARLPNGYGHFHVRGKDVYAHRFSYQIHHGILPPKIMALHRCDNRACVRPDHLFSGTAKTNTMDMHNKNRWKPGRAKDQSGEKNARAKLTMENVLEIRKMAESGIMQNVIAAKFRVSTPAVNLIVNKKNWSHI